jgi:hypothetical protein
VKSVAESGCGAPVQGGYVSINIFIFHVFSHVFEPASCGRAKAVKLVDIRPTCVSNAVEKAFRNTPGGTQRYAGICAVLPCRACVICYKTQISTRPQRWKPR